MEDQRRSAFPVTNPAGYRLKDDSKALVFITDPKSVVYVPTVDGSCLMVSVANPEQFLAALFKLIGGILLPREIHTPRSLPPHSSAGRR